MIQHVPSPLEFPAIVMLVMAGGVIVISCGIGIVEGIKLLVRFLQTPPEGGVVIKIRPEWR